MHRLLLNNRWLVLAALVGLIAGGLYVMLHIAIDAFPDLTNNQVVVTTEAPGMSPTEVEQLVTFPIETALIGMPQNAGRAFDLQARPLDGHGDLRRQRQYLSRAAADQRASE